MIRLLLRFTPVFVAHLVLSQSHSIADVRSTFFDEKKHDTVRAEAAIRLADNIYNSNLDSAYQLIVKADTWSKKHHYKKGLSITQGYLGFIFHTQGDYVKGIECYQRSIAYNRKHNFEMNLAMDLGNYGTLLNDLNDAKAVDFYKKSIAIYKAENSPEDAAFIYSYIGGYFKLQNDIDSAIYYYNLGLESTSMSDTKAMLLRHMAQAYFEKDDNQEAFSLIDKALSIVSDRNKASQKILLITKLNICNSLGRFDEVQKCIELLEPLGNVTANKNASILYDELRASFLYRNGKFQEAYDVINSVYEEQNEYFNDELINLVKRKTIEYEYQEKNRRDSVRTLEEKEISEFKYESKLKEEVNSQRILWISVISLLLIIGLISFGYLRNRRITKIIESQNLSLESKNIEIIHSINYAKRIQSVILASADQVKTAFPKSFVFNKPRDIIGGDFYWFQRQDDVLLLAVADCTGHGVPGAILSVICTEALNRAVGEFKLDDPSAILNKVRELVKDHLVGADKKLSDGMDISLIRLKTVAENGTELIFSGANSSIFVRKNKQLDVYNGDRQPIGKHFNESSFKNTVVHLEKGDMIFLTTDGYFDQFGGPDGKKMKQHLMVDFLKTIQNDSISIYESKVIEHFESWKGAEEQLDDVCFLGIQLD